MDIPNAFVDHAEKPTSEELSAALGSTNGIWNRLVKSLADEYGVDVQEWTSYSLKTGWSLRLKLKKRNILYMAPCKGCFRPSDSGRIDRSSCFVSPRENAIIASRTIGIHRSYVSRRATSSRSINRIKPFLAVSCPCHGTL
jgi:hypothetical protein